MKRPILMIVAAVLLLLPYCVFAQTGDTTPPPATCESLSTTLNLPNIQLSNDAEHNLGSHYVSTGAQPLNQPPSPPGSVVASCNYTTGPAANCNTTCNVSIANTSNVETGTLNAFGSHMVAVGKASGSSGGINSGASCNATFAGAATNCFAVAGTCTIGVTINTGGISVTTNGHEVWQASAPLSANCGTQADLGKISGIGGGPPPDGSDPCATSTDPTVVGPADGSLGFTPIGCPPSPIIIDTEGEGFHLTSAANGVVFDIRADGHPLQIAWTDPRYHNAFLVLDRNGDGKISSGAELFGNFTIQDRSRHPNGFLALAEFDEPDQGGNGDGVIDERDAVFSKLRLWIDENHDGVSQPNELHKLSEFGIHSLTLSYFQSRKTDEFGNQFRYRARINPDPSHRDGRDETRSGEPGRWAYDVFFATK